MKSEEVSITTIDNPFNPFDDFNNWFLYDTEKGYYTCNKLARLSEISDDMTSEEENVAIEDAIDRLISIDPFDIYKKVYRSDYKVDNKEENDN